MSICNISDDTILRVIDIVDGTIVDGPGLRTSIYVAGCHHACPQCHNPQSWDFKAGRDMTLREILDHVEENGFNVTVTGGDPLYQAQPLLALCRALHEMGKTVWVYTGFTYEEILADAALAPVLESADVIVEGRFDISKRDTSLRFRGSSNQRIIDLSKSTPDNIVLYE